MSDVNISLPFYVHALGFRDVSHLRPVSLPYPGAFLQCGAQQIHLMQLPPMDHMDAQKRSKYPGRDRHLAIQVDSIDTLVKRLQQNNVTFSGPSSGRQALFCRDPDANGFEFLELP